MTIFNIMGKGSGGSSDDVYVTGKLYDTGLSYVGKSQFMPGTETLTMQSYRFWGFSTSTSTASRYLSSYIAISSISFSHVDGNPLGNIIVDVSLPRASYIDDNGFKSCTRLNKINCASVTSIGSSAFYGCTALTEISFPSVTTIKKNAFRNCVNLSSINLPNLTVAEEAILYSPTYLKTLIIPNYSVSDLTAFNIRSDFSITGSDPSGLYMFSNVHLDKLVWGCPSFSGAFSGFHANNTNITPKIIDLPKITYYPSYTFINGGDTTTDIYLSSLTSTIQHNYNNALIYGNALVNVQVPNLKSISGTFLNAPILTSISFPNLTTISLYSNGGAFYACSSLTSISFPKLQTIKGGNATFSFCNNLTSLNLPALTTIEGYSGYGPFCNIQTISVPNLTTINSYGFASNQKLLSFSGSKVTTVGYSAFIYCYSLGTVDLPNCTILEQSAFYNCSKLSSINVPKVTSVGYYCFNNCSSLKAFSASLCLSIAAYAFSNCFSLASISIPSVKSIGSYAFVNCYSLSKANIQSCSHISEYAFYACRSLSEINLPNCSYIGYAAFGYCSMLKTVSIPVVTNIQTNAFYPGSSTYSTTFYLNSVSSVPNLGHSSALGILTNVQSIYVPSSLFNSFKTATNWSYYSTKLKSI